MPNYLVDIIDDGNGNLIDALNNNVKVGNILYSQGMIIVTNQAYNWFFVKPGPTGSNPVPPSTFTNTIYLNKVDLGDDTIASGLVSISGQNYYYYLNNFNSLPFKETKVTSSYDGSYTWSVSGLNSTAGVPATLFSQFQTWNIYNGGYYPYCFYSTSTINLTSQGGSPGDANLVPLAGLGTSASFFELMSAPVYTATSTDGGYTYSSSPLYIGFNNISASNIDPTGTVTIKEYDTSTTVFNKTVSQIISDSTYFYELSNTIKTKYKISFSNIRQNSTHLTGSSYYASVLDQGDSYSQIYPGPGLTLGIQSAGVITGSNVTDQYIDLVFPMGAIPGNPGPSTIIRAIVFQLPYTF